MPIEKGTKVFIKETTIIDELYGVCNGDIGTVVDYDPTDGLYEIELWGTKTNKAFVSRYQFDTIPDYVCDKVRDRAKKSAEELSDREITESILGGLQKVVDNSK